MAQQINLLAQAAQTDCLKGIGPLGDLCGKESTAAQKFSGFISATIGIMTIVAFIWFIFVLFTGAISWLGSEGDKVKVQTAQKRITHGLVGVIIVISAIFLIKLVGVVFGIDILDIAGMMTNL